MPDGDTTIAVLRDDVAAFVAARDWSQFHNAKDLAISISIEAAELLEEFQWMDAGQVAAASTDPHARDRMRFELADVLVYCFCLANALELDVSETVRQKLGIAARKYPMEEYKGLARKPGAETPA